MLTVLLRVVADAVAVAILLFAAAGTTDWPRAWVLLGVVLGVRVLTAIGVFRVDPSLQPLASCSS